ncbi:MAG: SDR family oxidoreductase [Anaerolineaceae bacterium]|nr:SDR family oxidoreductase [Anaerolineaceae bacterium]
MILVTGASGHLGNVLVRNLLARGENVRALILPGEDCQSLKGLEIERIEGNVLDPASLDKAMQNIKTVFHLAGVISIVPGAEELMQKVNVTGVWNTANAALKAGVQRFIHTSSIHAFKRMPHGETIDEKTPLAPDSPAGAYDRTKAEGTLALREVIDQGLNAVITHPTGIIGPYDYLHSEMGSTILGFAKRKLAFLVNGAYDFVDVRDVANGLILAWQKGKTGESYILSGEQIQVAQIKQIVQKIVGIKTPQIVIPNSLAMFSTYFTQYLYRFSKITPKFTSYSLKTLQDNSVFSNAKARSELGYQPRSLQESIRDTLQWWKSQFSKLPFSVR